MLALLLLPLVMGEETTKWEELEVTEGGTPVVEGEVEGLDELDHLRGEEVPATKVQGLPKGMKKLSFTPPQLSDEEVNSHKGTVYPQEYSPHLPSYLACDACLAVAAEVGRESAIFVPGGSCVCPRPPPQQHQEETPDEF